jgi:hypothetical protein
MKKMEPQKQSTAAPQKQPVKLTVAEKRKRQKQLRKEKKRGKQNLDESVDKEKSLDESLDKEELDEVGAALGLDDYEVMERPTEETSLLGPSTTMQVVEEAVDDEVAVVSRPEPSIISKSPKLGGAGEAVAAGGIPKVKSVFDEIFEAQAQLFPQPAWKSAVAVEDAGAFGVPSDVACADGTEQVFKLVECLRLNLTLLLLRELISNSRDREIFTTSMHKLQIRICVKKRSTFGLGNTYKRYRALLLRKRFGINIPLASGTSFTGVYIESSRRPTLMYL